MPSRSSKVTDFGMNRMFICNFLLVYNSNFHYILHRFQEVALIAIFLDTPSVFNPPDGGVPL